MGWTILNEITRQPHHLHVVDVQSNTAIIKMPEVWETCTHSPFVFLSTLGSGSFGKVRSTSSTRCVKTFDDEECFYHEMVLNDIINIAKLKEPYGTWKCLLSMETACISCQAIIYTRYDCTVETYPFWRAITPETVVRGFTGLIGAVEFLNHSCGIFHSDISTSNLFIKLGKDKKDIASIVLADIGVGSLHAGNTCTNITVLSNKTSQPLHEIIGGRDPFYVCKDMFKPCSVLFRCYCMLMNPISDADNRGKLTSKDPPVSKRLAKRMDLASLAYCLLEVLEKVLDTHKKEPTINFLDHCTYNRPHPLYYLAFMAPKVVMCKLLSTTWKCKINLGMDTNGNCDYITLTPPHKQVFRDWCQALERRYLRLLFQYQCFKIRSVSLRQLTLSLLAYDKFGLPGQL